MTAGWRATSWIWVAGAAFLMGLGILLAVHMGGGAHGTPTMAGAVEAPAASSPGVAAARTAQTSGRQVIERGSLSVRVRHVSRTAARLTAMTAKAGGFVESQRQSGHGAHAKAHLTLRVPEGGFARFMSRAAGFGRVLDESQSGTDVTSRVSNLNVQIAALTSEIKGYEALYQRATAISSMIKIQKALSQAEAELLNLQQERAGLHQEVRLATVNVTLSAVVVPGPSRLRLGAVFSGSIATMRTVGSALLDAAVWLAPWALAAALVLTPVLWRRRRRAASVRPDPK